MSSEPMCPPDHKHAKVGTCYNQHGCRCSPCRTARADVLRNRHRAKLYGRYVSAFVPAAPVREHVLRLQEQGLGWTRTVELAGVSRAAVQRLLKGRLLPAGAPTAGAETQQILRTTAEAILSVRADLSTRAPGSRIPARGVHRRVEALMAIGWSLHKIAYAVGENPQNFAGAIRSAELVTIRRHVALAEAYERLSMSRPPLESPFDRAAATRSMNTARRNGWAPPLAWDDIDEDEAPAVADEQVDVDEVAVELAIAGAPVALTPAERRAAVVELHSVGRPDGQIATTLRCNVRTITRIRSELDLPAAVGPDRERIVA